MYRLCMVGEEGSHDVPVVKSHPAAVHSNGAGGAIVAIERLVRSLNA